MIARSLDEVSLMDKLGISGFTVVDSTVGLALGTQIGLTVVTSNEFVRFVSHGMANNMEELTQFMSPSLQQGLIFLSLLLH